MSRTPGSLGRIQRASALATVKKNTASAMLNTNTITAGWKVTKPTSPRNTIAPPTAWLVSK